MKKQYDSVESIKTAIMQTGSGIILGILSIPTKFPILFLIAIVLFGMGVRGLYKAHKA
jgi:hypothetical protein